jgi:methionyl-tRNA formyltransferase
MIVIAGKNNIAIEALNYLILDFKIQKSDLVVICNQTDNGVDNWHMSLKKYAHEFGVREISLKEAEDKAQIFFSLEFDKLINLGNFKTNSIFNIHFSLLPKYKGMYTSLWPILNEEKETGCTLHEIDNGIDTGKIIDQVSFQISMHESSADLYQKYIKTAIYLFKKNFKSIYEGKWNSTPQSIENSTYFSKKSFDFSNARIDINTTAWQIGRQIRALSFRQYQLPRLFDCNIVNYEISSKKSSLKPGSIINEDENHINIATIDYDMNLYKDKCEEICAILKNYDLPNIEEKLKHLTSIEDRSSESLTLLMLAALNGRVHAARKLIQLGADVNAVDYQGATALMYAKDYALKSGNRDIFRILIASGADIEARDLLGRNLNSYISENDFKFLLEGA